MSVKTEAELELEREPAAAVSASESEAPASAGEVAEAGKPPGEAAPADAPPDATATGKSAPSPDAAGPAVSAWRDLDPSAPISQPVIEARGLSLTFQTADGPVDALSNIDLVVEPGEFVSLIGPSGCGKTTLLRVIADLEQPTAGAIRVNGVSPAEARWHRLYGCVFQAPSLFPWRTLERNVMLPLEIMRLPRRERHARARERLALLGLSGFERSYPGQLSGDMQQRASIARALAVDPELLLMDEPFGAFDEIVRDRLNNELLRLWKKTGKTIVFATHSIAEAVFLSTRIVVMSPRPGRIIEVIDCTFPSERGIDIRDTPEFVAVAQRVRAALRTAHGHDD